MDTKWRRAYISIFNEIALINSVQEDMASHVVVQENQELRTDILKAR